MGYVYVCVYVCVTSAEAAWERGRRGWRFGRPKDGCGRTRSDSRWRRRTAVGSSGWQAEGGKGVTATATAAAAVAAAAVRGGGEGRGRGRAQEEAAKEDENEEETEEAEKEEAERERRRAVG